MKALLMKKSITIISVTLVVVFIAAYLGLTWWFGNSIEKGFQAADAESEAFTIAEYDKGLFASNSVMALGEVEESSFSLNQNLAHGPLAFSSKGPKLCASHITSTIDLDSQPAELRQLAAKLFGEGVPPFVAETTVSLSGLQSTRLAVAAANCKEDDLEVRFDGAVFQFNLAADQSEISLSGDCPPLYVRATNSSDSQLELITLKSDGVSLDVDYQKGSHIKSDSQIGKTRFYIKNKDEPGFRMETVGMEFVADMDAHSREYDQVFIGNTEMLAEELSFDTEMGEFKMSDLKFVSTISDNSDGTVNMEGGYLVGGIHAPDQDGNPMAGVYDYLQSGAAITFKMENTPYGFLQQYGESQTDQLQEVINLATQSAEDPARAEKAQQALNAKNAENLIESLEFFKKGMKLEYDITLAPGDRQSNLGLALKYTNENPVTSLATVGELVNSLELSIDGKIDGGAIEAFPMLGMMLQPQVEQGFLKADPSGNFTISASLIESQLTVNGEPSPMQMMIQMLGATGAGLGSD